MRNPVVLYLLLSVAFCVAVVFETPVFPQSQAQDGQIEGTVFDQNNAAVPNALITVTNTGTGSMRSVTTDAAGVFRFPLLPLGTYRITVEAVNFKRHVRSGIVLAAGNTATVDLTLEPGEIREVVNVDQDRAAVAAGSTDLGRVINAREVQGVPLVTRNPYNLGILQANVTGRPSRGFNSPNLNVNGYLRRVNYLIDGNTNTGYDRRTRFLVLSETAISGVQLITNGFAAEFGDTPGMIMNVITPSGTNKLHGTFSYRFRRPPFYSRQFFFPADELPRNRADIITGTIGGPVLKDRWHYYFGYEWQARDDNTSAARLVTITPANRNLLIAAGLSPTIFPPAIPSQDRGTSYVFRTDLQIDDRNRLAVRFNHASINSKNAIAGRLNTLERGFDAATTDHSLGVQVASYTSKHFNELRFGYSRRNSGLLRNSSSGSGPTIIINGVANFGSPQGTDTVSPPLAIIQIQDNVTRILGRHDVKFGFGFNHHDYTERAAIFSLYQFPSIGAYVAARNGVNLHSYSRYEETFGSPETNYKATFWDLFLQDDWKATPRIKINFGMRYDFYQIPKADPTSLFYLSKKFKTDKNDFAPRLGLAYVIRNGRLPTVLRVSGGIYYEAPLLAVFRDVLRFNGNAQFFSLTFRPNDPGSPSFPNSVGSVPVGAAPPPQDIYTISPDYDTMYAIHSSIQIEQAITNDLSFALGYVHSGGRHLNVYRNINPINPVRYLADGRPVFGDDRLDDRFGWIVIAESAGVATYDALSLQLKQRVSRGLQFTINYTLSRAINDSPDGDFEFVFLSDPNNRNLDKGFSSADQRHTLSASIVWAPSLDIVNRTVRRFLNNNQFSIITTANSGQRFNITANISDLNHDDITGDDRPVGIKRNSGKTPPLFNVDLRYSRLFNIAKRYKIEVFAEFQNFLNTNSIVGYSNTMVDTDAFTGRLIGRLPDFRARNQSIAQESRQFQLGIKCIF